VLHASSQAFSRDDAQRRVYVQHVMPRDAEQLYRTLITQRGHLYICGNRNLPAAVQVRALEWLLAVLSGCSLGVDGAHVQRLL
jgi:sulfite reductase alpha subunit-like flavoprotein